MGYFGAFGFHPKSTGGGGGSGSVTAVGAGTGMNFPTITGTGNVNIDTTKVPYYSAGFVAGFSKWDGANWIFDNSTYLTTSAAALTYQPLLGYTPVNKAGDTMTGFLILNADPTNALGAVTKQYVDNISGNVNFHSPTYAASTTNLVATYLNGTAGVGATLTATSNGALNLDGVDFSLLPVLPQPYRVLIWQQSNQIQNGIYDVTQVGNAGNPFILTRSDDADNSPTGELSYGDFSLNQNGTLYGGYGFIMNATGTIIIGTSNVTYVQYNVAQAITAGFGLTELPANTLNVDTNVIVPYTGATTNLNLGANYLVSPTIHGSTTPSGTLTLSSTTNVTKGNILFGTSAYNEVNNRLGIGTTTPTSELDVVGATKISGLTNIGNATNTNQRQLRVGQDTSYIDLGSLVGATGFGAIYINKSSPNINNYTIASDNSQLFINSSTNANIRVNNIDRFIVRGVVTSGANPNFNFINPSVTGQTASTNVPNFRVDGATKQWATGNITNQYWNYFSANTADFVSASTITNSYGLYVESANVSATATITNNYALGLSGNFIANLPTIAGYVKIYDDATFNYIESDKPTVLKSTGTNAIRITAGGSFSVQTDGSGGNKLVITTSNNSPNSVTQFTSILFPQSGCLASTEVRSVLFSGDTKTWQNGNIATQRWFHITANTAAFASAAHTITNSYGLYVEAATEGTNATITNNYALGVKGQIGFDWTVAGNPTMRIGSWLSPPSSSFPIYGWGIVTSNELFRIPSTIYFGDTNFVIKKQGTLSAIIEPFDNLTLRSINTASGGQKTYLFGNQATGNVSIGSITATERLTISGGNILLEDAGNFIVGTTTGTKFGTSTSQKLGFFNATPIPQPPAVTTVQGLSTALSNLGLIAVSSPSIWNVTPQAGATYIASNNDYVLVNASTQTITLPSPALGRRVGVKVITSVTNIQVITNGSGITIDGVDRSSVGLGIYNQWDAYTFVSSGSAWYIES